MDRGAKIHLVQAPLGHSAISTMGRYLHARPDESSALYLGSQAAPLPRRGRARRTRAQHAPSDPLVKSSVRASPRKQLSCRAPGGPTWGRRSDDQPEKGCSTNLGK